MARAALLRTCPPVQAPAPRALRVPSQDELLALVRARGPICLQDLAQAIWPELPWRPLAIGDPDSVSQTPRSWPDDRLRTAGEFLREELRGLIASGLVALAPFRTDRFRLAGLNYRLTAKIQPGCPLGPERP